MLYVGPGLQTRPTVFVAAGLQTRLDRLRSLAGRLHFGAVEGAMIRKLKTGQYRLYSRKKNPKTGRRRNLGTFGSRAAAERHERAVQFFKRQ